MSKEEEMSAAFGMRHLTPEERLKLAGVVKMTPAVPPQSDPHQGNGEDSGPRPFAPLDGEGDGKDKKPLPKLVPICFVKGEADGFRHGK
jgi:hypothetical protein